MKKATCWIALSLIFCGCSQQDVVITDPDGNEAPLYSVWATGQRFLFWLVPAVFLVLSTAGILHWRRNREWGLLLLALAAIACAVGLISGRIAEMPLRGATIDEIASGSRRPFPFLMQIQQLAVIAGFVLAFLGGLRTVWTGVRATSPSNDPTDSQA